MGWQEKDPSTELGGGGYISLENLFFARNFPNSFRVLIQKQEGERALWDYPFAPSGVNVTSMLIQMPDPEAAAKSTTPKTRRKSFRLLYDDSSPVGWWCGIFKDGKDPYGHLFI